MDAIREMATSAHDALFNLIFEGHDDLDALEYLAPLQDLAIAARWRPAAKNVTCERQQASALANFANESAEQCRRRITDVVKMLREYCLTGDKGEFWAYRPTQIQKQFLMTYVEPCGLRKIAEDHNAIFNVHESGTRWYIKLHEQARSNSAFRDILSVYYPRLECPSSSSHQNPQEQQEFYKSTSKKYNKIQGQTASPRNSERIKPPPPTRPVPERTRPDAVACAGGYSSSSGEQARVSSLPLSQPPPPRHTSTTYYQNFGPWQ